MQNLTNQVALVTGASSGIGQAIAHSLAQLGASVCMVGRSRGKLIEAAKAVEGHPHIYECDITHDDQVRALPVRILDDVGRVDILIHSAAIYTQGPLETAPVEDFDLEFRTNLRAPYLITQQFLPQLKSKPGQIVFINSTQGVQARPLVTQYAAVKFGLRALADSLRQESRRMASASSAFSQVKPPRQCSNSVTKWTTTPTTQQNSFSPSTSPTQSPPLSASPPPPPLLNCTSDPA